MLGYWISAVSISEFWMSSITKHYTKFEHNFLVSSNTKTTRHDISGILNVIGNVPLLWEPNVFFLNAREGTESRHSRLFETCVEITSNTKVRVSFLGQDSSPECYRYKNQEGNRHIVTRLLQEYYNSMLQCLRVYSSGSDFLAAYTWFKYGQVERVCILYEGLRDFLSYLGRWQVY
jgi:hypothetical protein